MDSQECSWEYVQTSKQVYQGPCEIVAAHLVPSGASTGTIIYNGQYSNGKQVLSLEAAVRTLASFKPPVPVYCDQGIYITIGSNTAGVLIQWRAI